ncbi:hypothetical protein COV05_03685 [Candidatus Uhrbacteria bacterium CG10_big_fil_rev_8_21_14_0_10_48_16]|uniref:Citrate transporter-like domain-containing protein n=1 Tax=Candidatus Uhrbacteria bacterium CG10_big_fil_rev_8_21_14_0_10_48_16 TaxID=1975038 RepID=A0A2M8LGT7_9BACT|nr:MAG: hypothetical protein COV05_03685 [Candidatus Uhrbacteria bacterium CG10_big_fil_rev_8_21_14_0_10_48_16]
MDPFLIAIVVFLVTYAVIISEKIHRTVVALAGAILMILLGVVHQEAAIEGIDFNTIGLLIGMMVVVGIAKDSGMFQYVALQAAKVAKGKPIRIFLLLGIITALFSALLDNVTTVLLMVPVTFVIANNLKLNPKPFLFSAILLSNIGGAATLIGDPPNIIIGSAAGLSFNDFLMHMGPISAILTLATALMLYLLYRKDLKKANPDASRKLLQLDPRKAISDVPLLKKSLFVLALILVGFITHGATGLEGATIALAGAALLLLLTMNDPEKHLHEVEWTTIFFFAGLFVLVVGLEEVGAVHMLAEGMIELTHGDPSTTMYAVLWGSALFSAIVDNIPFVATMIPLIQNIGELTSIPLAPLWWALALGADIGGNLTLVGASANVVVSGMAHKEGHKLGFFEYMKVAVPMTIVALIICTIYVGIRYT